MHLFVNTLWRIFISNMYAYIAKTFLERITDAGWYVVFMLI